MPNNLAPMSSPTIFWIDDARLFFGKNCTLCYRGLTYESSQSNPVQKREKDLRVHVHSRVHVVPFARDHRILFAQRANFRISVSSFGSTKHKRTYPI